MGGSTQVPSINLIYLLSLTLDIRCTKVAGAISSFFLDWFLIVFGLRISHYFSHFFHHRLGVLPVLYLSLLFSVSIRFYGEGIRGVL